jgi:hypothetical protein
MNNFILPSIIVISSLLFGISIPYKVASARKIVNRTSREVDVARGESVPRNNDITALGYFYLAEHAPLIGGRPSEINVLYLSESGLLQVSRETNQDEILSFNESRVEASKFFDQLDSIGSDLPSHSQLRSESNKGLVQEYYPPHVQMAIKFPGKTTRLWEGNQDAVPLHVQETLALVKRLAAQRHEGKHSPIGVYIRASLLPQSTVRQFLREGFVKSVGSSELGNNPYLSHTLAHPFRLVFVDKSDNPFAPFWTRFEPRRGTLELSLNDTVFQVRALVYANREE